jgi:hypothetical protein
VRHLTLTQPQEAKLVTYLETRLVELKKDNEERIKADKDSDLAYENDKCERAKLGGIWGQSNLSAPLTSMVVDHFASKSEQVVFGREPMATFEPEGPADTDLARGLNRFAAYKLFKVGKVRDDLLDCQHTIFRHRAQILKATYDLDVDEWEEGDVNIIHDSKDQQPVLILNHGYIIEGRDAFVEALDIVSGLPVQQLQADPTFILDPMRHYWAPAPAPVRFTDVKYAGPKSREVDSDCFFAPTTARSLDECDCLGEYYDKPIHWVRERFLDRPWINVEQFVRKVKNQDSRRKTEDERQKEAKDNLSFDRDNASLGIVEVWLERDVLGWGKPQRIVLWMERKTKTLIDYEFQKKVTPDGRHPYNAVAIAKIKQRWWGYSIPEMVKQYQEYVDLQFNRHSNRNSLNANPIIAQNPDAIVEKQSFNEIVPGQTFTLESGKTINDWLQTFMIPKGDLDTQMLLDKCFEWVRFWLGISNLSQGDYSDVPQNTTLGGQEATLREAQKLSNRWTRRQLMGYQAHLTKLVEILLVTMDEQEVYTYLEGDVEQMGFITATALQDLIVNAKLVMAKESGAQSIQEQQMTLQVITQYVSFPPEMQMIVRPVMKKILYLLGHDDVDALLPVPMMPVMAIDPMTGKPIAQPGAPAQPSAAADQPPVDVEAQPAAAPAGGEVVPFKASANG